MSKKVIVTGAAGFIGSNLCRQLLESGHDVTGVDSFTDYYDVRIKRQNAAALEHERFSLIEGSLNDLDLDALLSGVACIFHQAAQAGVRASWGSSFEEYIDCIIRATQRLCEAAREKSELERFVYASSSSVYGDTTELPMRESHPLRPVSPYGATKLDGENMSLLYRRNYGLPVVCLRYFTVYGPGQRPDMAFHRFIRGALSGTTIEVYGNGEQTRDFTLVDDIVSANMAAMEYDGDEAVFNIGGGGRVPLNHVLDVIGRYATPGFDVQYLDAQKGDVTNTFADITLAMAELGYAPAGELEEGLDREVDWVRSLLSAYPDYQ